MELPEAEEAEALLTVALAFIDDYEQDDSALDVAFLPTQRETVSAQASISLESAPTVDRSTLGTRAVVDQLRRARKKAERELLLQCVQDYEEKLALLKLRIGRQASRQVATPWTDVAIDEAAKRRAAEKLNGELRLLLARNRKTIEAISDLLTESPPLPVNQIQQTTTDRCFVPADDKPPLPFAIRAAIMAGLKRVTPLLFETTDSVFSNALEVEDPSVLGSLSCSVRIKQQDPASWPCIELATSTVLPCDLATANSTMWGMLLDEEWIGNPSAVSLKSVKLTQQSVELGYTTGYCGLGKKVISEGVSVLERREEEGRVILVSASLVVHDCGRPCFRSRGWIVITRSPTNPLHASVVRTCCRLLAASPNPTPGQQSPQMRCVSRQLKAKMERVQQKLLEKTGALDSAAQGMVSLAA